MDQDHNDPFDGLTLDDDFVRGAAVAEQSAAERAHRARVEEEIRRLVREQAEQLARRQRAGREDRDWLARQQGQRSRQTSGWRSQVARLVLVALAATAVWTSFGPRGGGVLAGARDSLSTTFGLTGARPPAGVDAHDQPLGRPAPAPSDDGSFDVLQGSRSNPVAFDPCRPIHIVVNERTAPREADDLLEDAIAEVSHLTGLRFIVDGTTTEPPTDDRQPYQPERYGERWAPVLVAWTDPAEWPDLADTVAGTGGSLAVRPPGTSSRVYVTGTIALDGPHLELILQRRAGYAVALSVIKHEFGHLVGLDHVDDAGQLMNAEGSYEVSTFQDGDKVGLNRLGQGRCFPQI